MLLCFLDAETQCLFLVYFDSVVSPFPHCAIIHNLYVINCVQLMLAVVFVWVQSGREFIEKQREKNKPRERKTILKSHPDNPL